MKIFYVFLFFISKKHFTFALATGKQHNFPQQNGNHHYFRRDGRVVDYSGLENRRAERHRGFESLSLRRKYSGEDFRKHFKKSVSIVASISYDTFVLYLHVFSEYVRRVPKRPKYSPTVTIWLQKDEPNKNCNQEYVQRLFRVLICCCYSNDYVELCSGIYGSSFHPFRR